MARQPYRYSPSKQFFAYSSFTGGMNTVDPEESLEDNEWRLLQNVDLDAGGGASKRHGFKKYLAFSKTNPQGFFKYYTSTGAVHDIVACNGELFKGTTKLNVQLYNEADGTYTTNSTWKFQTTRPIEAVQYGDIMFIATGTLLLEYDGSTLKQMKPYKPTATEVIKIGVNALASNPNDYIAVGSGSVIVNEGITADKNIGIVSKVTQFRAIYSKPSSTNIEIKWEYRKAGAPNWELGRNFSTTVTWNFTPSEVGMYDIRTTIRASGDTEPTNHRLYILAEYKVSTQDENKDTDVATIHTCNRVMMYYEQLLIYGDNVNKNALYVSDVYRPNYVPALNSLTFSDIKNAEVTAIVKYYNILVVFTKDNVWGLSGENPMNFKKISINSSIGCIAPFSARAVGNHIFFLSREGVYKLKSIYNNDNRLNVESIDVKVRNIISRDEKANAVQYNNQYHLVIPSENSRYRYYHQDLQAWVVDKSDKMSFERIYTYNGELYGQDAKNGSVYIFDTNLYSDDGLRYDTIWESKGVDCGLPYHKKKPKEIYFSFLHDPNEDIKLKVYIYVDDNAIITPEQYKVVVQDNLVIYTPDTGNLSGEFILPSSTSFGVWTLGSSELGVKEGSKHVVRLRGSGHRVKFKLMQDEDNNTGLLGFGLTTKISKPTT